MKHSFKAKIYSVGINWCVDVPRRITKQLTAEKGYIKIKGQINGFNFTKTLMPVKNSPYRLFVNQAMMKGGGTALGKTATFKIEQNPDKAIKKYAAPKLLMEQLKKNEVTSDFNNLTPSRRKDILKYLSYIKTTETLSKNISKLIKQLRDKETNVRIP
jgi:hypothetical protein